MHSFAQSVILPFIRTCGYRKICEIGAQRGENTDKLLIDSSVNITVIDPCLDRDLLSKYSTSNRVKICMGLSLDILPILSDPFDCILIDGDHNWYTVFHELTLIEERNLILPGGTIFLHDVEWPCGRRDLYYQLETIPVEFRQPCAKKGVIRGQSSLSSSPSLNDGLWNADHEGGPRNGVLTAIEDFLKAHRGQYFFFSITSEYGLGVLQRRSSIMPNRAYLIALVREKTRRGVEEVKEWASTKFPWLYSRLKEWIQG